MERLTTQRTVFCTRKQVPRSLGDDAEGLMERIVSKVESDVVATLLELSEGYAEALGATGTNAGIRSIKKDF